MIYMGSKLLLNNKKRQLIFILLSFGFFSLSRGLWYNYQHLWLQENEFTTTTISIITGLASLLSVSVIFLLSNLIKRDKLKKFITSLLFIKLVLMFLLFVLDHTGYAILIKFLIMVDLVVDTSIVTSIYPVISLVQKNDFIYSLKGIISSTFYDLGVLGSGFFLGKVIIGCFVSYNILLLMAIIMMIVSFCLMVIVPIRIKETSIRKDHRQVFFRDFISYLKKDSVSCFYFLYVFLGNVAFYSIVGLKMLMLTDIILISPSRATGCLLVVGIIADIVAFLILKYFTSKNYFVNILVKFGGRLVLCLLSFLTNNIYLFMATLFYSLLFSEAYSHVNEAPYINRVVDEFQLSFVNLKGMLAYFAQAIGIWFCGFSFLIGVRYMFGVVAFIILLQILVMIKLYRMRSGNKGEIS